MKTKRATLRLESLERRELLHGGEFSVIDDTAIGNLVPDFSLVDVNTTSEKFEQQVSPRDYIGRVTAWYFGHAT